MERGATHRWEVTRQTVIMDSVRDVTVVIAVVTAVVRFPPITAWGVLLSTEGPLVTEKGCAPGHMKRRALTRG